jgi:transposase-like protein
MLVPRQQYSRELKIAAMREIESGKGIAEVARMFQVSPKRLETWKGEWRAKGELAFPGNGSRPVETRCRSDCPAGTLRSFAPLGWAGTPVPPQVSVSHADS